MQRVVLSVAIVITALLTQFSVTRGATARPVAVVQTAEMGTPAPLNVSQLASARTVATCTSPEKVALTFDAGAGRGYAAEILNILREYRARASFGMTGKWAEGNPDLVIRMRDEQHPIFNHTYSHASFTGYSSGTAPLTWSQRQQEVERAEQVIGSVAGVSAKPYFRPPYGDYDGATLDLLGQLGYTHNAMWSVDTRDWTGNSAADIVNRVMSNPDGAIVLMHVGSGTHTREALPEMIRRLRETGHRLVTLEECLSEVVYFPETGHTLRGVFLNYWRANGGLPVFGYPITEELQERNTADGQTYTVQYFERQRFEYHPRNSPPYHVLLGLVGREHAQQRGLTGTTPFRAVSANSNCEYFPETGHNLCWGFRSYWHGHGLDFGESGYSSRESLALFGYPISEEFRMVLEDGREYTVQYFERARLEWHPQNQPPYDILQGRLAANLREGR